ncbi:hypothetical protein D1007_32807 [Hordeum vulgare]|nr:hypothetical protein D1007_32807 [Hordeum vulgare]
MVIEFNSLGFMLLKHGWKSFALADGLQEGYVHHFKFDGATMLFMKAFGNTDGCLDCCMEGDSSGSSSPSGTDGNSTSSSARSGGDNDSDGSLGTHFKEEGFE